MFQSTRPVRGATRGHLPTHSQRRVSIHAPRAGRDMSVSRMRISGNRFNPRAPCGARPILLMTRCCGSRFQSTRPVRGATIDYLGAEDTELFQSTRPVRGATGVMSVRRGRTRSFNPRAPCGARQQKKLRLPSFATYLWVLLATNMIFSMSEQRTLLSCAAST